MAPLLQPLEFLGLVPRVPFLNCPQCRKSCQGLVRPPLKSFPRTGARDRVRTGPPAPTTVPPESLISQADPWAKSCCPVNSCQLQTDDKALSDQFSAPL